MTDGRRSEITTRRSFLKRTGVVGGAVAVAGASSLMSAERAFAALGPADGFYNVRAFGALGTGQGNDAVFIQAAINAAITGGGGIVYLPPGDYNIENTLDFSSVKSDAVTFLGAGSGGIDAAFSSTSRILNSCVGPAIKAQADGSNSPIVGLHLRDFGILNKKNIGLDNYTIYWDGVAAQSSIRNIYIRGHNVESEVAVGNGVAILNCYNGQSVFENISVWNFRDVTSHGFWLAAPDTYPYFPNGLNSGNFVVNSCSAVNCFTGWRLGNGPPGTEPGQGNVINSVTLNSCKAVNESGPIGLLNEASKGFLLDGSSCQGFVFNGPHAEQHGHSYYLKGALYNHFVSPHATAFSITTNDLEYTIPPDPHAANFRFVENACGNTVENLRGGHLYHLARFEDTSRGNKVSGRVHDNTPLATPGDSNFSFVKPQAPVPMHQQAHENIVWAFVDSADGPSMGKVWREIGSTDEPSFENSWVNYAQGAATAAYFKDATGVVHLKGLISSGAVGEVAFTLPDGYRPSGGYRVYEVLSQDAVGRVDVLTTGAVKPTWPSINNWVSLEGISFRP